MVWSHSRSASISGHGEFFVNDDKRRLLIERGHEGVKCSPTRNLESLLHRECTVESMAYHGPALLLRSFAVTGLPGRSSKLGLRVE